MSEISKYEAQKKKLDGLCEEHDLTYRFRHDDYPITLTIMPLQGVEEQLSMLEEAETKDYISPDASMVIYRKDGEQAVVDSFHGDDSKGSGEKAYTEVMAKADFYLAEPTQKLPALMAASK